MLGAIFMSVFVTLLSGCLVLWFRRRRLGKLTDAIPGPEAIAVFGNSLQFPKDPEEFYLYLEALCTTHKDTGFYRLWFGPHLTVFVYRADLVEPFFNSSKHITKSFTYKLHHPWLKLGLLTSTGEKWRARRKMITPTFHFKILEEFLEVMNAQVDIMVDLLEAKVGQGHFDIQPYVTHCTLDIICETAMGCQVNAQREQSDYVQAIYSISEHTINRLKTPWLWWDFLFWLTSVGKDCSKTLKVLHGFTRKVIKERSAEFDRQWEKMEKGKREEALTDTGSDDARPIKIGKRMAFLDMLLWNAKKDPSLDFEGIQEEVDTFMFEGHDTTAATTVWALYFIGKYPEVQAKLHQEVDQIFGHDDRPMTMEDLSHFKYLECVFKESMRLHPTVPMYGRQCSEDCEIGGCHVPKGSSAFIMTVPLHRDPKYFSDPEKFDPDRWITDNPTKHPFSYVPFSAGLRNCIGQKFAVMEEKVLLSGILRRFSVTCTESDDIERSGLLILRPSKGLRVELTRRSF